MLFDRPIPKALFLEKSAGKDRFQILRAIVDLREQVLQRGLGTVETWVNHNCTPLLLVISVSPLVDFLCQFELKRAMVRAGGIFF